VDEVYDEAVAKTFGLEKGQVTVMIHCGSRGAGHQICDDHLRYWNERRKNMELSFLTGNWRALLLNQQKGRTILKPWLRVLITHGRTGR